MPNLGERGEEIVRRAARRLGQLGEAQLARELSSLYRERPVPTVGQVPGRVAEVFGKPLAHTKGNAASEEWARELLSRQQGQRRAIFALFLSRPRRGWTPREMVEALHLDPAESLNSVRRAIQTMREARLLEDAGARAAPGRERPETVRRLSDPVRRYYADEQPAML